MAKIVFAFNKTYLILAGRILIDKTEVVLFSSMGWELTLAKSYLIFKSCGRQCVTVAGRKITSVGLCIIVSFCCNVKIIWVQKVDLNFFFKRNMWQLCFNVFWDCRLFLGDGSWTDRFFSKILIQIIMGHWIIFLCYLGISDHPSSNLDLIHH